MTPAEFTTSLEWGIVTAILAIATAIVLIAGH